MRVEEGEEEQVEDIENTFDIIITEKFSSLRKRLSTK
jgi:hypothetical protein